MKKTLVLNICLVFLTFGANAFALVAYDQTDSFSPVLTLNNGKKHSSVLFSFNKISDNFIGSATTAYPTLSLVLKGSNAFSDVLRLSFGNQSLATFNTENPTYTFNATALGYLNNAITANDGSVTFSLVRNSGTSSLSSAKLTGAIAPEPASMTLVCAGLVNIPFARRLRNAISAQF
jgi:hypothetical protein